MNILPAFRPCRRRCAGGPAAATPCAARLLD